MVLAPIHSTRYATRAETHADRTHGSGPQNMKYALTIVVLGTALLIAACGTESAQRATFETLQNLRQQECEKNRDADCLKRENYDDYQRQRQQETPANN